MGIARKNELACCDSGPRVTAATRRLFLTMQLVAKGYTESVASLAPRLRPAWTCVGNVQSDPLVSRQADISPKLNQALVKRAMDFSLVRALVSLRSLPNRRAIQPSSFASFFRGELLL